jgi:hypothetical protein
MDVTLIASYWLYFLLGWIVFGCLILVGQVITFVLFGSRNGILQACSLLSVLFTILCGLTSTASFIMFVFSLVVMIIQSVN